jgi:hypothetical protein
MIRSRLSLLLTLLAALSACSQRHTGTPLDSGAPVDAPTVLEDAGELDAPIEMDAGDRDGGEPDAGDPPGSDTYEFVIAMLDVGRAADGGDPGVVPGFDLDGRVSDEADALGCYHVDNTSPPPDLVMGVDNRMGPLLASLGSTFDVTTLLADNIASGLLILLARVSGIGSLSDDPVIQIELYTGSVVGGAPILTGGRLAPGQTFAIDRTMGMGPGRIVAGRVRATGLTFALDIPAGTGGAPLSLRMSNVETRFDISATGLDVGVLGGAMEVEDTIAALIAVAPDTIPESLARSILAAQADLSPDASGECKEVSLGLVFDAVPAVIAP